MYLAGYLTYGIKLAALFLCLVWCAQSQKCYSPNGSEMPSDQGYWAPCLPTGGPCCRESEACLSNGLCFGGTFGLPYRGACTNKDWTDCQELGTDIHPGGWTNMWHCGAANTKLEGPWWVGDENIATPCESGQGASFTVWPSANVGKVIQRATSTSSSASASTSQAGQTRPASSSTPSTTSASSFPAKATLGTSSGDLPSVPVTNQPGDSSGSGDTLSLALGIGLGVPLGVASIGFLAFLLWKARRQKQPSMPSSYFAQAEKLNEENFDQTAKEMGGNETAQEMWAKDPKELPEMDSRQQHEIYTRNER